MESYKGICVQRLSNGEIFNVHVEDATGIKMTFPPDDYISKGIKPDIDSLEDLDTEVNL